MQASVDSKRFGPWALITGASSGIGREFARQIAGSHIDVVLVARRQTLLDALGTELSRDFGVKHRSVVGDLSEDGFIAGLAERVVYRELFPRGLTALDQLEEETSMSHVSAQEEVSQLLSMLKLPIDERGHQRAAARDQWFAAARQPLELHDVLSD